MHESVWKANKDKEKETYAEQVRAGQFMNRTLVSEVSVLPIMPFLPIKEWLGASKGSSKSADVF